MVRAERVRRVVELAIAIFVVYCVSVLVTPVRRFDDATKRFAAAHEVGDRLRADHLPDAEFFALVIIAGCIVALVVHLVRARSWQLAARAIAVPVIGAALSELGKLWLPRPALALEPSYLGPKSFPSGHVAVAVGCLLAARFAVPDTGDRDARRRARLVVGTVTAAMVAMIVLSALHRLLDAVGAALLAALLATAFDPDPPPVVRGRDRSVLIGLVAAAVVTLVVGATVPPSDLAHTSTAVANVCFALAVVVAALTGGVVAIVRCGPRDTRSDAASAASTRSPRTADRS